MVGTTLGGGSAGRGGIEETEERAGEMGEVNWNKTMIDVDDVSGKGYVDDVDGKKLFEVGKMCRKRLNVEDVRVGREV